MPSLSLFLEESSLVFKNDRLGSSILKVAFPAAAALAADPIASLIDTAFIGHLGSVQLAAVGVAISLFNQASRIAIFPIVGITTSFVAEEDTLQNLQNGGETTEKVLENSALKSLENGPSEEIEAKVPSNEPDAPCYSCKNCTDAPSKKRHMASASTSLVISLMLGLIQTVLLSLAAKPLLHLMGVKSGSTMLIEAMRYLVLRSLGSPAVLLSFALQGVFRGFQDTKTPLYAIVIGDVTNIILDPILIFSCKLGISGAAIAHVVSQYLISAIMLFKLMMVVAIVPPSLKGLQITRFLKNGSLLLAKVVAATICVTIASSMAARLGAVTMAAFQICVQVWMASSLLADGLAVAGQALIASAFAEKDYVKAKKAAVRVLQMGFILGLGLAAVVWIGLYLGSGAFSKDKHVLHIIKIGIPFVAGTQPLNSLAFVFDGVNYGSSDFAFSAVSMVMVATVSIPTLFLLSKFHGFAGIWIALTLYMGLRFLCGMWRMVSGTGPWCHLYN